MFRLYDGFYKSIVNAHWKPTGVLAISKLLEKIIIEKNINPIICFYVPYKQGDFTKSQKIFIKEFDLFIYIIISPFFLKFLPQKIAVLFNIFYFALKGFELARRNKIDLFYTDRGNVVTASLITKILKKPTILRLLGMPRPYFNYLNTNKIIPILLCYAFKTNFKHVIATFDGSSIHEFCKLKLNKNANLNIMINGIKKNQFSKLNFNKKVSILFLGRIEKNKGIENLIKTIVGLPFVYQQKIIVNIIGEGSQMKIINELVKINKLNHIIKFHGALEHEQVLKKLKEFDIYISFNQFGQLSNTNLEAISSGLCLVISKTNEVDDKYVKNFGLNNKFVKWFKLSENTKSLQLILKNFIDNPNEIITYKKKSRELSKKIPNFSDRIKWEINLIKKIVSE